MEQKYNIPSGNVFALLTDPAWLEERSLALGELSASVKAKKSGGGIVVHMKRRVHRDLPKLVAKVLSPDSDLVMEETWSAEKDGVRTGVLTMDVIGQPLKMTAQFELVPAGNGCIYRIEHKCKSSIPLVGGAVEKFALGQIEQGCADEFSYLLTYLKKHK